MLGTILNQIQALLPKRILIGVFIPVLLFAAGNAALLYSQRPDFRAFADRTLLVGSEGAEPFSNGTGVLLILFLASVLISMLNTVGREVLEGRYWPRRLREAGVRRQWRRFERLQHRIEELQAQRVRVSLADWSGRLAKARGRGPKQPVIAYSTANPAEALLAGLRQAREDGALLDLQQLRRSATTVRLALRRSDLAALGRGGGAQAELLERAQADVQALAEYAEQRLIKEINEAFDERDFGYPYDLVLAPTSLGNVARSIESYADTRYGLNFAVVWTRLQKTMQAQDDPFTSTLQDAKTQVDFLVNCIWFGALSLAGWLGYFVLAGYSLTPFLLLATLGPATLGLLHALCVSHARAFAALVRSAIDLFRLKLLAELHVPLPEGALEERGLWGALNRQLGYGEVSAFPYEHPR